MSYSAQVRELHFRMLNYRRNSIMPKRVDTNEVIKKWLILVIPVKAKNNYRTNNHKFNSLF